MNLDAMFRPYVVGGFFLVILIALPFRIKSQATGEKLDRRQEGVAMAIVLRLGGLAVRGGVIAFMIDPESMAWSSTYRAYRTSTGRFLPRMPQT